MRQVLRREATFDELQRAFAARPPTSSPFLLDEGTIVVLPSLSFPTPELRKIVGIEHYEERMLFAALLLANPRLRVVYLSSLPIDQAVIDYYLSFLPDPDGARCRLELVPVGEREPRALSEKLLARPDLLGRVRDLVEGVEAAYVLPFNVTRLEAELAECLGIPVYGPHPDLARLGSKTGSRRMARQAGVAMPDGWEGLRSLEEIELAVRRLRARRAPGVQSVVVKLNNGFSGQGNAVVDVRGPDVGLLACPVTFAASEESWPSFLAKIDADGAIVEELVRAPGLASPSVQLRIAPDGRVELISTHNQLLGGPDEQVYLGCRFPAADAYRVDIQRDALRVGQILAARGVIGWFAIDFLVVPLPGGGHEVYLSEINLRVGGTTHPFWMARLVTGGRYDARTGQLVAGGQPKAYVASDNVKAASLVGTPPAVAIDRLAESGLAYDPRSRTGATLHLLGALQGYGKLGLTCIADSPPAAEELYREATLTVIG